MNHPRLHPFLALLATFCLAIASPSSAEPREVSEEEISESAGNVHPAPIFTFGQFGGIVEEFNRKFIEEEWNRLSVEQQKQINNFLVVRIGLSSTGKFSLVGVYGLSHDARLGKAGDKIFQFQQADLGGARLFRIVLINPTSKNALLLYSPSMELGGDLLYFGVLGEEDGKQASADQPATCSDSKSEGNDKLQQDEDENSEQIGAE